MIKWIKQRILFVMRAPMTAFLRRVEAGIPRHDLSIKHLQYLKALPDREHLLALLPKHAVVAELGVDQGGFSEKILQVCEPSRLHLIDFWGSKRYNTEKQKGVFRKFKAEINDGRVVVNLGLSTEVVSQFENQYFDWIYIDTDHTYETTIQELELYREKLKPNGIIAGHDYIIGNWLEMRRYGVIEAVHEFCIRHDWEIIYITVEMRRPPSFAIRKIGE